MFYQALTTMTKYHAVAAAIYGAHLQWEQNKPFFFGTEIICILHDFPGLFLITPQSPSGAVLLA